VAELKALDSDLGYGFYSELDKVKWIIVVEPSATFTTTKIQLNNLEELEEGECIFHS
jgi:hypothetical protein